MASTSSPDAPKYLLPRAADAVGPQNEAEQRLFELINEGIQAGPARETTVSELTSTLRARIRDRGK